MFMRKGKTVLLIISRILKRHKNFVIYCIIGVSGVTLDFTVFYLLNLLPGMHYQFANFISVSCGITNNFILNAFFNFKTRDKLLLRFLQFYAVGVVGIIISSFLLNLFIEIIGLKILITKLLIIFIVTIVQYTLNRTFSFRRF